MRWGKQMCLNVRLAFYFCRLFLFLSLSFTLIDYGLKICDVGGLEA
jgi:hypothetical protein